MSICARCPGCKEFVELEQVGYEWRCPRCRHVYARDPAPATYPDYGVSC